MAIQKTAMNLFEYYKHPVDAQGRPIQTRDDAGGDEDEGSSAVKKFVRRPVLTEDDLKRASPILGKVIGLPKYQLVISKLRKAANEAKSGVVNFVIGKETEIADAIMKAAFPPGSGVVYRGVDGYSINTADDAWGNPNQSKAKLTRLLRGNVRALNRKEFSFLRGVGDRLNGQPVEQGKARPAPLMSLLEPAMPGGGMGGGEGAPAGVTGRTPGQRPGTPPAAGAPAQGSVLERFYNMSESISSTLDQVRAEMSTLDRFDKTPDRTDPAGLSPAQRFEALRQVENRCYAELERLQGLLPQYGDWSGQAEYDGTGFMDFRGDVKHVFARLQILLDPQKVLAYKQQSDPNVPRGQNRAVDEQAMRRLYDQYKGEVLTMLQSLKRSARGDLEASYDAVINILGGGFDQIQTSKAALEKAINNLVKRMASQNMVMVLHNVSESGLVTPPPRGMGASNYEFAHNSILANEYISRDKRNKRCIIMVSRHPITFGFHGVERISLGDFTVDDDEGQALVLYFVNQCWKAVKNRNAELEKARATGRPAPAGKTPVASNIKISYDDIKRLSLILQGKTQVQALQLLTKAFAACVDKETGSVNGKDLVKEATALNNDAIRDGTFTDDSGEVKGLYRKTAKITMDHYIHSKRTDWGTRVGKINNTISRASEKMALQDAIREKITQLENGGASGGEASQTEIRTLRRQVDNLEKDIKAIMQGTRHFMILYGSAGCGKSAYAEALANQLGFDLLDIDFGQARGGLVGQTETWGKALIESWKRLSNVVIRMDEMDGQVVGAEAEGRQNWDSNVMKNLLSFFQDCQDLLYTRNIFIVATTNNRDRIRKELRDRAEESYVPEPFDQEGYLSYLNHACDILKASGYAQGFIYNPDQLTRSKDLWPETEALMDSVKPELPRIAAALVNTGLNFRRLGQFIGDLWDAHMRYVESSRKARMFQDDRRKFMEEYPKSWTRDPKTGEPHFETPQVEGVPFTADNVIKAATMTYPTDVRGNRISLAQRALNDEGYVHFGITELEREIHGGGPADTPGANAGQIEMDFGTPPESDDSLMRPADAATLASHDYYYNELVKKGIIRSAQAAKAAPQAAEPVTPMSESKRISKGDFRDGDVIETGIFWMGPVPDPRRIEM